MTVSPGVDQPECGVGLNKQWLARTHLTSTLRWHLVCWLVLVLAGCGSPSTPPTPSPQLELPTVFPTATLTLTPSTTPSPTQTLTVTVTPTSTETGTVTPTPTVLPTLTETPLPTSLPPDSYHCPGTLPIQLRVDDLARVTYTDGRPLRVRSSPDFGDNILTQMPEGEQLNILSGPICYSDPRTSKKYVFWQIRIKATGVIGWSVEGERDYFMEPLR
jgi:hypothetical protein